MIVEGEKGGIKMLSKILSSGLLGIDGYLIDVEVDLSNGLPAFDLVGLPDSAVKKPEKEFALPSKIPALHFQ